MKQFTLPQLPYAANALEPVISKQTIDFHYGKHLQAYINNLNKLIAGTEFEDADLETIIKKSEGPIFNNAAQTWNHTLYFNTFSPDARRQPEGKLLQAIEKEWGTYENFKKEFMAAGNAIFGSGWVWLAKTPEGKLLIRQEGNAGNPLTKGYTPLLGIDVWEHSYYLDYQNRRADHLEALWSIIDWKTIEARY
ncbi:MAG: superoxide dismutase [Odoribacter sp.]